MYKRAEAELEFLLRVGTGGENRLDLTSSRWPISTIVIA